MTDSQVARYADVAMFAAEPDAMAADGELIAPRATVVSMTPNPLRAMAAASEMYKGHVVRDPAQISKTTALEWFADMSLTSLNAPMEFIDLHLLIEGVSRPWANQLERQRTAVYVQESLRFAVKRQAATEVSMPWTLREMKEDDPRRVQWQKAVDRAAEDYNALIDAGVAAEDARSILPMNITTRVHYKTNLRNLKEHAGYRLCSQAQDEWKAVWLSVMEAIRHYGPFSDRWQQEAIASLFKPICYQTGNCEFNSSADRYCPIRQKVVDHAAKGEPSSVWVDIDPITAMRPGATRLSPDDPRVRP